jgi:G3E family GTPase
MILLNKLDLVSADQVDQVEQVVRSINPTLRLHKTTQSQIDLKELFDLRAYSAKPVIGSVDEAKHDHAKCIEEGHDHTVHNSGITTVLIPLPTLDDVKLERLNAFLESLLWSGQLPEQVKEIQTTPEILRTKGFINMEDGREMVLQGVTDLFELKEATRGNAGEGERVEGKVVFIGRRVDERLRDALLKFLHA